MSKVWDWFRGPSLLWIAETVERMEKMRRRRRADDGGPQTADVPETINRP